MKRLIAVLLTISMLNVGVYAVEPIKHIDDVSTQEQVSCSVKKLFSTNQSSDRLLPISVNYVYTIDNSVAESRAYVHMNLTLNYATLSSVFSVSGEIPIYTLSNNRQYMYGALEGQVVVNDVEYKAIAGFQKYADNPNISVSLTLVSPENELVFKFGDLSVKYNTVKDVLPNTIDTTSRTQITTLATSEGNYQYQTSSTKQFNGKKAITQSVLYYPEKRRGMLRVTPYLNNVESIYTTASAGTATAVIAVDKVSFIITEKDESQTYFSGFVVGDTCPIGVSETGGTVSGKDALSVIASIGSLYFPKASAGLGVFTSLVGMLPTTSTTRLLKTGSDMLSAEYSNLNMTDQSWDDYGIAVAFQLAVHNAPSPTVNAVYNYWSEIRYSVTITDNMGDVSHVYLPVETSKDYTITTT